MSLFDEAYVMVRGVEGLMTQEVKSLFDFLNGCVDLMLVSFDCVSCFFLVFVSHR